jgi:hypothetical protein
MENLSSTPITDAAERQLEMRKQFMGNYSDQLTVFFTEKIKSAFDVAMQEIDIKHNELMQQSKEMLQLQNSIIINTDGPTEQTGNIQNGHE